MTLTWLNVAINWTLNCEEVKSICEINRHLNALPSFAVQVPNVFHGSLVALPELRPIFYCSGKATNVCVVVGNWYRTWLFTFYWSKIYEYGPDQKPWAAIVLSLGCLLRFLNACHKKRQSTTELGGNSVSLHWREDSTRTEALMHHLQYWIPSLFEKSSR